MRVWLASPTAANSSGHSLRRWRYAPLIAGPQEFVLVGTGSMTGPFPAWVTPRLAISATRVNAILKLSQICHKVFAFVRMDTANPLRRKALASSFLCDYLGSDRVPSKCSPEQMFLQTDVLTNVWSYKQMFLRTNVPILEWNPAWGSEEVLYLRVYVVCGIVYDSSPILHSPILP